MQLAVVVRLRQRGLDDDCDVGILKVVGNLVLRIRLAVVQRFALQYPAVGNALCSAVRLHQRDTITAERLVIVADPKCSTCKKAQKWLDESNVEYTLRDIKTDNPTAEELKAWWEKSGLPLKRFFNTSGNIYKEMKLKDKLPEMSEEEQLALLATDGMLVKRPILVGEDKVLVGAKEKEWEEYLKS